MRIFIALDIDEAIRHRIARFMDGVRGFAPDARWVRPESLHITLKFIGETAPENVDQIKEDHPFSPHLTLARGGGGSGSPRSKIDGLKPGFQRLQEKLVALPVPEFGTMTAREFFLYQSHLSRGGSRYEKLAGFTL